MKLRLHRIKKENSTQPWYNTDIYDLFSIGEYTPFGSESIWINMNTGETKSFFYNHLIPLSNEESIAYTRHFKLNKILDEF